MGFCDIMNQGQNNQTAEEGKTQNEIQDFN
jgi:hypothetical protein